MFNRALVVLASTVFDWLYILLGLWLILLLTTLTFRLVFLTGLPWSTRVRVSCGKSAFCILFIRAHCMLYWMMKNIPSFAVSTLASSHGSYSPNTECLYSPLILLNPFDKQVWAAHWEYAGQEVGVRCSASLSDLPLDVWPSACLGVQSCLLISALQYRIKVKHTWWKNQVLGLEWR